MSKRYKTLFWITLSILLLSNLFWLYIFVDNAVGQSYRAVSCDEFQEDTNEFKKVLKTFKKQSEVTRFLNEKSVKFDTLRKGDEFIISFQSFDLIFDNQGRKTKIENR